MLLTIVITLSDLKQIESKNNLINHFTIEVLGVIASDIVRIPHFADCPFRLHTERVCQG